ncbi:MAG: hypothetical protein KDK64_01630, partial [Chlamydiia bacterium]|nr:hypothetical protein [Chlamydiia bacterium]
MESLTTDSFILIPRDTLSREIPFGERPPSVHEDHMKVGEVFRQHVTDPTMIAPYEVPEFPNYPGTTNLLYIPSDLYHTLRSIYHAVRNRDQEEFSDATARLAGIPANLACATGYLMGYGLMFKIIPQSLSKVLPFLYAAGVALCIIEGGVHAWALNRQLNFEAEYDFDFLSNLRYLVSDYDPVKTTRAIRNMAKLVNEEPESLKQLYGDQFEQVKQIFNQMHEELEDNPYDADLIIKKYASPLEEIARLATMKDLKHLEETFLQLNPNEVTAIHSKIVQQNPDKSPEEIQQLTHAKLKQELAKKKKNFARRVRPWMVSEASETISPILGGITLGDSEAIKEGLRLADDIHVQSQKKKIVHILGIIALVFAIASLVAMCVSCPASIPFILVGIATVFALGSYLIALGS